jgi:plastocyanin
VNTVSIKTAQTYNKKNRMSRGLLWLICFFLGVLFHLDSVRAWDVDLSRRRLEFDKIKDENRLQSVESTEAKNPLSKILESTDVAKDIVILNSEKGFIPDTIQLRQGLSYRIHVVNVNEQKRNVSFIIDAFGQHHNTVYSTPKSFQISPKTEGIFSYQCPESSLQGKIVVLPQERSPASTK